MTDFESPKQAQHNTPSEIHPRAAYVAPRIVSYSAEELDKHVPQVTACDSFNPNAFAPGQPGQPSEPGGKF